MQCVFRNVETQAVCILRFCSSIEGGFNVIECDDSVVWSYSIIEDCSLKVWMRPRPAQPLSVSTRRSAVVQTQLGIRYCSAETPTSDRATISCTFRCATVCAETFLRGINIRTRIFHTKSILSSQIEYNYPPDKLYGG